MMNLRTRILLLILVSTIGYSAQTSSASPIISGWLLEVVTQDFDGQSQQIVQSSNFPISPFITTQTAVLGQSSTIADWNVEYGENFLSVLLHSEQVCKRVPGELPNCSTNARMNLQPTIDVRLKATIDYQYSLPSAGGTISTGWGTGVSIPQPFPQPSIPVFSIGDNINTGFGSLAGQVHEQGSVILTAGNLYRLTFGFSIHTFSDVPNGVTATGTGDIAIQINSVPQPASLFPLALSALLLSRRRAR